MSGVPGFSLEQSLYMVLVVLPQRSLVFSTLACNNTVHWTTCMKCRVRGQVSGHAIMRACMFVDIKREVKGLFGLLVGQLLSLRQSDDQSHT